MNRTRALSLGVIGALLLFSLHGCLALVDFKETCLVDSDCAAGLLCNGGQCTDSCNQYSDCGSGKTCDSTSKKCVAIPTCTSSTQAQACKKYACNTSKNLCYTACDGDSARCGATADCDGSECQYLCVNTYDSICSPYACYTLMGYCRHYCISDDDCASGYTCNSMDECVR
jgi:hypothetical protein